MDLMTNDDNESSIIIITIIIGIVMIIIIITIMPGIANVGGLAGTQMPERVLSDAYEKGGKQMIGHIIIIIIILFITLSSFNSSSVVKLITIIICCNNFEPPSELYQESDCPFGDSLMVMGEGFSQVDSDEDVHDKG